MKFEGTIPAVLCPFLESDQIDEAGYKAHIKDVSAAEGVTAITVNGHASEMVSCTFEEQRLILDSTLDVVGSSLPIIGGVYNGSTKKAAEIAKMSEAAGAKGLLIFPSDVFQMGGQLKPDMALRHYSEIANATSLPFIIFQYPEASGMQIPLETLVKLAEEIPTFAAIKDWCNNPLLHQYHIDVLHNLPRPVSVLTTHSSWLLPSLVMGPKGLLSGAGSVIAAEQAQLLKFVQSGDLKSAQELDRRLRPTVNAFYSDPFLDMHNRMKEALVMLGRFPSARVRPPLTPISNSERSSLRQALIASGLMTSSP
ncbi:dihydrodipicolinate synthase family protein [uncultured Sneathiella sp.]|uniref:dihydrodipicolinate synthase family protein n=1 Tax=uncultured Sneathiella sp. TaxID=879315 RepID=UPI002599C1FF|nr:dihydrodipicolinate synthase family protein [uncultured Sneathiella sp.]